MSETKQIAEMASKVSSELFDVFKWKMKKVEDHSWKCVVPEDHGNKNDHPSDCVFFYRDPYSNEMVYINTDLKSYAKKSIDFEKIRSAIRSLSYAVNCAAFNENWSNLFKPEGNFTVVGMLFVYNHCGTYKGDFDAHLANIDKDDNHLAQDNLILTLSPHKIVELMSIANDIEVMSGRQELPSPEQYCFYHPNEMMTKNHFNKQYDEPATIKVLTSPWIIVKHAEAKKCKPGYLIYYTRDGSEEDEFIYFLDAISYYQILSNKNDVRIKFTKKNEYAVVNLKSAIKRYFSQLGYEEERIEELSDSLFKGTISEVKPQFTSVEIGLVS